MNDPQNVAALDNVTGAGPGDTPPGDASSDQPLQDRTASGVPRISSEPLVAPPSFAQVPMALVKQPGVLAAIVGAVLVGLLLIWRSSRD